MNRARFRASSAVFLLPRCSRPSFRPARSVPRRRQRTRGRPSCRTRSARRPRDEAAALQQLGDIRSRRRELDAAVAGFGPRRSEGSRRRSRRSRPMSIASPRRPSPAKRKPPPRGHSSTRRSAVAEAAAAMYAVEDGAEVYAEVLDVDNLQDAFSGTKYLAHLSEQPGAPTSRRWPGSRSRSRRSSNKRRCNATRRRPSRRKRKASARSSASSRRATTPTGRSREGRGERAGTRRVDTVAQGSVRRRARVTASDLDRRESVPRSSATRTEASDVVPRRASRSGRDHRWFREPRAPDPRHGARPYRVSTCRPRKARRSRRARRVW